METFLQLTVSGLALGCIYALIALGFTVVLLAGVINFAQGGFMLVGAALVSYLTLQVGVSFWLALLGGIAGTALLGMAFERFILRSMSSRPVFTLIMITLGLDIILRVLTVMAFGYDQRANGDPWGLSGFSLGTIRINWVDVWIMLSTLMLLAAFYFFFKYSKYGIAMRATAHDQEGAAAIGINLAQVYTITWAITGLMATVAGVFLAASPRVLDATLGFSALRALPAIILGGLGSTVGAVVGGLILGLVEVLASGYIGNAPGQSFGWLGVGFHQIATYVVLIIVLLVKPYGLFGKKEITRV